MLNNICLFIWKKGQGQFYQIYARNYEFMGLITLVNNDKKIHNDHEINNDLEIDNDQEIDYNHEIHNIQKFNKFHEIDNFIQEIDNDHEIW